MWTLCYAWRFTLLSPPAIASSASLEDFLLIPIMSTLWWLSELLVVSVFWGPNPENQGTMLLPLSLALFVLKHIILYLNILETTLLPWSISPTSKPRISLLKISYFLSVSITSTEPSAGIKQSSSYFHCYCFCFSLNIQRRQNIHWTISSIVTFFFSVIFADRNWFVTYWCSVTDWV